MLEVVHHLRFRTLLHNMQLNKGSPPACCVELELVYALLMRTCVSNHLRFATGPDKMVRSSMDVEPGGLLSGQKNAWSTWKKVKVGFVVFLVVFFVAFGIGFA